MFRLSICSLIPIALLSISFTVSKAEAGLPHLAHLHNAPPKCPCPPPYVWYAEGAPWLKFKKACPRPVCDPCSMEHYGYYATCWRPWSYPPDYSHCPAPPPGAVLPPPAVPPYAPKVRQPTPQFQEEKKTEPPTSEVLPTPRRSTEPVPSVRLIPQ